MAAAAPTLKNAAPEAEAVSVKLALAATLMLPPSRMIGLLVMALTVSPKSS